MCTGFPRLGVLRRLRPTRTFGRRCAYPRLPALDGSGTRGTITDGSHVHRCSVDGLGPRLCPCGIANGYAVDLLRGLPTQAGKTRSGVLHPPRRRADTHRKPAHIHRVRAGARSRGVTTTSVSLVDLPPVSLTGPDPSGSTGPPRLCQGCSHRPRQPPVPAASSFTRPLRRPSDGGLSPPSEQATPRGAIPVLALGGSVHAMVLRPRGVHRRLAIAPPAVLPSTFGTAWAPRISYFAAQ